MKVSAIVLFAGASTRFDAKESKQVYLLKNKPVFEYSLNTIANSKEINELIVVVNKNVKEEIESFILENNIPAKIILGGKTRQVSVELGLKEISLSDIVLIHDGARPLIDEKIIHDVVEAALETGAATAFIPETDSIVKMNNDSVENYLNRNLVGKIQTPQAFNFALLKEAHKKANNLEATDDCSLVTKLGTEVKLVLGSEKYRKITRLEDIKILEAFLND